MKSKIVERLGSAFLLAFALAAAPVFAQHSSASTFTQVCAFRATGACNGLGFTPLGGAIKDSSGNIFGTLSTGGSGTYHADGAVFELTSGGTYNEIWSFCSANSHCGDGAMPMSNLIMDVNGNLYGTTEYGGKVSSNGGDGVVFELVAPTVSQPNWTEKVLYRFCSVQYSCSASTYDGANPLAGLTYAGQASGMLYDGTSALYGTTSNGGNGPTIFRGTVFQLVPGTGGLWTETILHNFCSCGTPVDGSNPTTGLTVDSSGNLYGTAEGAAGHGMVYELSYSGSSWGETVLYTFCPTGAPCTDGAGGDETGVSLDGAGHIWGTTPAGGSYTYSTPCGNGCGVLYELTPAPGGGSCSIYGLLCETVVHSFCATSSSCPDGAYPSPGLGPFIVRGASPITLYATTTGGGDATYPGGVLYTYSLGYVNKHNFCGASGCPGGTLPVGGLTTDSSGTLYGTTQGGGSTFSFGTLFSFTP